VRNTIGWCAALFLTGCAAVDPQSDYQLTSQRVAQATGGRATFALGDEAIVRARVDELLDGGLTSDEAVQIALLNNPRLRAALYRVGIARADVVQAGLFSNPSLALSMRLPEAGGLANVEWSLAQNIAELWLAPLRAKASEQLLAQTVRDVAREVSVSALDAKAAYFSALAADEQIKIAASAVTLAQQIVDVALDRQEAGAGSEIDVNLARSELLETQLSAKAADLARFETRQALAVLCGLTLPPQDLALQEPLADPPRTRLASDTLVQQAALHRVDIEAAQFAVDAAEAQWKTELASVFKSVELGVSMERSEQRGQPGRKLLYDTARASIANGAPTAPEIQSPAERHIQNSQQIETIIGPTLGVELPIFDQNQAQIAKARMAYEQSKALLDALMRETAQEIRLAGMRVDNAADVARFHRDSVVPLREASLQLAREAYSAGQGTLLSVLDAERALISARGGYVRALERSSVAGVDLQKAVGRPLADLSAAESEPVTMHGVSP
jgi:cobalt-zinc-cadmium efflux system outer membrane protein